jgi:adenylylsulfate kinase
VLGPELRLQLSLPQADTSSSTSQKEKTMSNQIPTHQIPTNQTGAVIWFTGLSGAGKTTIAHDLEPRLRDAGHRVELLDGDAVRETLSKGLGFSREDRDTNIRRIGFVANLLAKNGVLVLVSAISPYRDARREVLEASAQSLEVFVDAPLEVVSARDVKGLYAKAIAGEIKHFTGVSDPYEAPTNPDLHLRTDLESLEQSVERVLEKISQLGFQTPLKREAEALVREREAEALVREREAEALVREREAEALVRA